MKFAVVSDIHLGDPMCSLVEKDNTGKLITTGMYENFKTAVGTENDYLILLGDILDFSISKYPETFDAARVFFTQIQTDQLAKEIIFVPGNHDADLWHTVEYQVNIINRIENGKPVRPFRLSVPGIIDERKNSLNKGFTLAGVTKNVDEGTKYAGLFLDSITQPEPTVFNFAYPNIYVVTNTGSVLITHGHYFEAYWAFAGEWALKIGKEDLKIGGAPSVRDMVGINFPLSQLACSGIGQAGPLTNVVRTVQREVKDKKLGRVEKYLNRLEKIIDEKLQYPWYKRAFEFISDECLERGKEEFLKLLGKVENTRYSEEFINKDEVMQRFLDFYSATIIELDELNFSYFSDMPIPLPRRVIFGHTHQPIPWNSLDAPRTKPTETPGSLPVFLYNTGGWLYKMKDNGKEFTGAEVFTYSTDKGFGSVSVK